MGQRFARLLACAVALAASTWPVAAERVLNHSARRRVDPDQFAANAADELGHDGGRVLVQSSGLLAVHDGEHSDGKYREAVRRAVELLPKRPAQVVVIDVNEAKPEDRDYLLKLQAFILKAGDGTIYLTMHGDVLRLAQKGSRFHEYMLATVIWHEMADLDRADEAEARSREEALWMRFMLDNAVDRDEAMRYLAALRHRAPLDDREQSTGRESDRVVARVRKLLPRQPERIVVIDAERQPSVLQQRIEDIEGFVTTGERTVYLKQQGSTFQRALQGPGIWDYVLAITVWHEMAHIAGANEPEAQLQEEKLWRQFVVEGRVDPTRGLTYLSLLQKRRKPKS